MFKRKKEEEIEIEDKEIEKDELSSLKEQLEIEKKASEDFKTRLETAEREREDAKREREEFAQKYSKESNEKVKYQGNSIESLILAKQSDAERLKADMKVAIEAGNFSDNAELTADYAVVKQEIKDLERQKTQLSEVKPPVYKPKTATDTWIESHPLFETDSYYKSIALHAHEKAVREGVKIESPEYFQFVEKALDRDFHNKEEEEDARIVQSIPPSRNDSKSEKSKSITLTAREVENAIAWCSVAPDGSRRSPADAKKAYWEAKQEGIKNGDIIINGE